MFGWACAGTLNFPCHPSRNPNTWAGPQWRGIHPYTTRTALWAGGATLGCVLWRAWVDPPPTTWHQDAAWSHGASVALSSSGRLSPGYWSAFLLGVWQGTITFFLPNISSLASPHSDLTRNYTIHGTLEAQQAFQTLKTALTSSSILRNPDFQWPFLVHTKASENGIGAVLSHEVSGEEHPIIYTSTKYQAGCHRNDDTLSQQYRLWAQAPPTAGWELKLGQCAHERAAALPHISASTPYHTVMVGLNR